MSKAFLVCAAVYAMGMAGACRAQGERPCLSDDGTTLYVCGRGIELVLPRVAGGFYYKEANFVQNDTTFLYREYAYGSTEARFCRSSYFIVPRTVPDYRQCLQRMIFRVIADC